jgi:hypothetical protein
MLRTLYRRYARAAFVLASTTLVITTSLLSPAAAKDVPSHKLNGTYSRNSIETSCINNDGSYFNGPNGSYGCAGKGGTVTCDKKGACTGTCASCAPSHSGPGKGVGNGVSTNGNGRGAIRAHFVPGKKVKPVLTVTHLSRRPAH